MRCWDDYIGLLSEAAGLDDERARRVAEADAAYSAERRRLEAELVHTERQMASLVDRNTRLQLGVRDLVRAVGVTIPHPDARRPPIPIERLPEAMKSAEYDLEQWRITLDHLNRQRLAIQSAEAVPDSAQPAPVPVPEQRAPKERRPKKRTPIVVAVAAIVLGLVAAVIVAVMVVR